MEVIDCRRCPRLVAHRETAGKEPPRRFQLWVTEHCDPTWWIDCLGRQPVQAGYWGRPVPAFGDRAGWLAIIGLAPAAHGANRTGRMFTGDRSGDFLFAALHRAGLANQPKSTAPDDGLKLLGALITAACRCAPPGNRPTANELAACSPFLAGDLEMMPQLRVLVALGRIAHDATMRWARARWGHVPRGIGFGHGAEHWLPGNLVLIDSYHVSQQNTFTGRLTPQMFDAVLARAAELAHSPS
ncbi:MAG: uracil-DNA glycosylase [Acidobacteria bacterium]|nr:uracil-DNA glycosylase [Acidobacteriota bacterium]